MKFSGSIGIAVLSAVASAAKGFAGTSSYYAHGLSDADRTNYLRTLEDAGMTVFRTWITGTSGTQKGSPVSELPDLESSPGVFHDEVLDAIDKLMAEAASFGMKTIVSVHDGNSFGQNSWGAYAQAYGSANEFYKNTNAQEHFDNRTRHVLNYVSPSLKKPWKECTEYIMAFDIENEPMVQANEIIDSVGPDWFAQRAKVYKEVLDGSPIAVSTGGVGGSSYAGEDRNYKEFIFKIPDIDIVALHGYDGDWDQWVPDAAKFAAQYGKQLLCEEWGSLPSGRTESLKSNGDQLAKLGIPFVYWMVIPGQVEECFCDDDKKNAVFEISTQNDEDFGNFKKLVEQIKSTDIKYDFSKWL